MTEPSTSRTVRDAAGLVLDPGVLEALRTQLPAVADLTVAAVIDEVPSYTRALNGPMGDNIVQAVQGALAGFVRLLKPDSRTDPGTPLRPALDGAYALGRGEARAGRTMDALLSAYRVGARVSWREMSATAVAGDLAAAKLARFAELVFAYIDELSAASVAGHSDELATTGRVKARYLERLAQDLLAGATDDVLLASAKRADWDPPEDLTAVVLPSAQVRTAIATLDPRTLELAGESDSAEAVEAMTVLLVPTVGAGSRAYLLRCLLGHQAVVGPKRPWAQVASSYRRALRAGELIHATGETPIDSDDHLATLVCAADREALVDLRAKALAPLAGVRPSSAERLVETLRSWLLHQGRREDVAADLVVHPQTIRYRMTQLRELYGDRLTDPEVVLDITIALALDRPGSPPG